MDIFEHVNQAAIRMILDRWSDIHPADRINEETRPSYHIGIEELNMEDAVYVQGWFPVFWARSTLNAFAILKLQRKDPVTVRTRALPRDSFRRLSVVVGSSLHRALLQTLHLPVQPDNLPNGEDTLHLKAAYGRSLSEIQKDFLRPDGQREETYSHPNALIEFAHITDKHRWTLFCDIGLRLEKLDMGHCYRQSIWTIALTQTSMAQLRSLTTATDLTSVELLESLSQKSGAWACPRLLSRYLDSLYIQTPRVDNDEVRDILIRFLRNAAPQIRNLNLRYYLEDFEDCPLPTFSRLTSLGIVTFDLPKIHSWLHPREGRYAHCFPLTKLTLFRMSFIFEEAKYWQNLLDMLGWMTHLRKLSLSFRGYQESFNAKFKKSHKLNNLKCFRLEEMDVSECRYHLGDEDGAWLHFLPVFGSHIAPNLTTLILLIPEKFTASDAFSDRFHLQAFKHLKTLILQLKYIWDGKDANVRQSLFSRKMRRPISKTVTSLTLKDWTIFRPTDLENIGKAFPALIELNIGQAERTAPCLTNPAQILVNHLHNLKILRFLEEATIMSPREFFGFLDFLTGNDRQNKPFIFHFPVHEVIRRFLKGTDLRSPFQTCTWLTLQ